MQTLEELELELDDGTFPLERYKPIELLGHGESGRAILSFDRFLEDDVVVKTLSSVELDQLIEFQREASKLCQLRCKSLARVVDYGATRCGIAYIVSEYQPGITLRTYLRNNGPLTPELAFRIFIPVAEALVVLHANTLLHRDLRPSNIQLRNLEMAESAVYLIDAGTGRLKYASYQANSFEGRTVWGDPCYMAPEQASAQHYDAQSEIFVLGCLFFESLTGRTPFTGAESLYTLVRRGAPSLSQVSDQVSYSYRLEAFVSKCLAKDPEARYRSMNEVANALKELMKAVPPSGYSSPKGERPDPAKVDFSVERTESSAPEEKQVELKLRSDQPLRLTPKDEKRSPQTSGMPKATVTDGELKAQMNIVNSVAASGSQPSYQVASPVPVVGKLTKESALAGFVSARLAMARFGSALTQFDLRHKIVAVLFLAVTGVCGWLTYSWMTYITAPREELPGRIYSYVPATARSAGLIELAALDRVGTTVIVPIVIDTPDLNLPAPPDGSNSSDSWSNDLHDASINGADSMSLVNLPSTSSSSKETFESDLRIGEIWQLRYRNQNGTRYLEEIGWGETQVGQDDLKAIHGTISRMYRDLGAGKWNMNRSDPEGWISEQAVIEINLSGAKKPTEVERIYPSQKLKLLSFNDGICEMMLEAPDWMSNQKYITVELRVENGKWRICRFSRCTTEDWERRPSQQIF